MYGLSGRFVRLAAVIAAAFSPGAWAGVPVMTGAQVTPAIAHDISPSLRGIMPKPDDYDGVKHVRDVKYIPLIDGPGFVDDPVAQLAPGSGAASVTPGLGFDGLGQGAYGFTVQYAPPDTTGAVGATQYVQIVNVGLAVFDKTSGALLKGPVPTKALWQGFGGPCEADNDGDAVVQYDKAANRWVLSQFAVPSGGPYLQCIAVSTTSDATGTYYRYAFGPYSAFNDYPKMGVWPDGYYVTYNMFSGNSFSGAQVCAMDRAKMLLGAAATQQCFQLSSSYGSLLPADLDGAAAPPAGTPNYLVNKGTNSLRLWKFHTDWATPANSTLTGPLTVSGVAAFNSACSGGACIPQLGTSQKLDSLADRLMFRLAYRNLGGVETMVVNHSVALGTNKRNSYAAVRWYELRNLAGNAPSVYQQGTYAPDTSFRWMGSVAMDKQGNIALGYSVSSSAINPGLRYATRAPTDPLGTLSAETHIIDGTGSQTQSLSRWGDYTHMSIDPMDDCTFWYVGQYLKADGTWNWSTRITSFKMSGCQ